jgi:competence protein ComEC
VYFVWFQRLLLFIIVIASAGCGYDWPSLPHNHLEIVHVDVGEGDATLFVGPAGTTILVDGGPTGTGEQTLKILQERQINELDVLIASHPHEDHIGGLPEIINGGINVRKAFDNGSTADTKAYRDLINAIKSTTAFQFEKIMPSDTLELGEGAFLHCSASAGELLDGTHLTVTDENDRSIALEAHYKGFDYHLGGDLGGGGKGQADVETPLGKLIGDKDVVHLHHHGSASSTNANWLNNTRSEVVVISVGPNSYGHPSKEVIKRLTGDDPAVTIPPPDIYQTGQVDSSSGITTLGSFSILTDGRTYKIDEHVYFVDE